MDVGVSHVCESHIYDSCLPPAPGSTVPDVPSSPQRGGVLIHYRVNSYRIKQFIPY